MSVIITIKHEHYWYHTSDFWGVRRCQVDRFVSVWHASRRVI